MNQTCRVWIGLVAGLMLGGQNPVHHSAANQAAPGLAAAGQASFKAIWEPAPFPKDLKLNAIACTGPETCWAAGDKSTILHTRDGGKSWTAQLGGDPDSNDEDLAEIHFFDATHGWALTERYRLLMTADGASWIELGKLPSLSRSVCFRSPQSGFVLENSGSTTQSTTQRTEDGGRGWKPAYRCTVDTAVGGLARKLPCGMRVTRFVSPSHGFMGGGAALDMATETAAFAKTSDGGETWSAMVIPNTKHRIADLHFWSEQQGIAVLDSGQVFWTADSGATWTGSTNPPRWRSHFGGAEGKILVAVHNNGNQISYSFNGGKSFSSRAFTLPARVSAVTFPGARHGYLVGEHGMVYRYRVVPAGYTGQGVLPAAAP